MSSGNRFLKDNDSFLSKGSLLTNRGAILTDVNECSLLIKTLVLLQI